MSDKKTDLSLVSYSFGIISIVLAFFQPLAGFVFGVIGIIQSRKQKTELSEKTKKLSIIGIILSLLVFILSIVAVAFFNINDFSNFPVQ